MTIKENQIEDYISDSTQTALDGKLDSVVGGTNVTIDNTDPNNPIINTTGGGTSPVDSVNGKTGVVVLDTSDIADTTDARYITDAEQVVIGNTSGTNTGDQIIPDNTDFVDLTTAQTVAGVKTFTSSPIVPTPTTDLQAATKKYVDDNAGGGITDIFEASMSADYSLTTSFTTFPFNTENIDTGTNYNNATYEYTAPTTGNYFFASFGLATGLTSLDSVQYGIYVNGTVVKAFNNIAAGTTQTFAGGTCVLALTSGDLVTVRGRNGSAARGSLRSLTNSSFSGYKLN